MRLVRFEDINGRETFVNADRVNHVSDFGSGTTEINFGDKASRCRCRPDCFPTFPCSMQRGDSCDDQPYRGKGVPAYTSTPGTAAYRVRTD
jgi:hypothetical protein